MKHSINQYTIVSQFQVFDSDIHWFWTISFIINFTFNSIIPQTFIHEYSIIETKYYTFAVTQYGWNSANHFPNLSRIAHLWLWSYEYDSVKQQSKRNQQNIESKIDKSKS